MHFPQKIGRVFTGRVKKYSEKGLWIEVILSPSFKPVITAPKSQTILQYPDEMGRIQRIEFREWWFNIEGENLNKKIQQWC